MEKFYIIYNNNIFIHNNNDNNATHFYANRYRHISQWLHISFHQLIKVTFTLMNTYIYENMCVQQRSNVNDEYE